MTTMTTSPAPTVTPRQKGPGLWLPGLRAGVVAAVATTLTAGVGRLAGADGAVRSETIPMYAFAQLTLVGAVLGIVMAKSAARWATHPRSTFVRSTVALTVMSLVPDALVDATVETKVVLALGHVVAAAIIVPVLAGRLRR